MTIKCIIFFAHFHELSKLTLNPSELVTVCLDFRRERAFEIKFHFKISMRFFKDPTILGTPSFFWLILKKKQDFIERRDESRPTQYAVTHEPFLTKFCTVSNCKICFSIFLVHICQRIYKISAEKLHVFFKLCNIYFYDWTLLINFSQLRIIQT